MTTLLRAGLSVSLFLKLPPDIPPSPPPDLPPDLPTYLPIYPPALLPPSLPHFLTLYTPAYLSISSHLLISLTPLPTLKTLSAAALSHSAILQALEQAVRIFGQQCFGQARHHQVGESCEDIICCCHDSIPCLSRLCSRVNKCPLHMC